MKTAVLLSALLAIRPPLACAAEGPYAATNQPPANQSAKKNMRAIAPALLVPALALLPALASGETMPSATSAGSASQAWDTVKRLNRDPDTAHSAPPPAEVNRMLSDGSIDNLRGALNAGGPTVKGRMTAFGGSCDRGDSGATATRVASGSVPGVAVNVDGSATGAGNRSRLNGYWLVKMADGDWIFRQIDLGPGSGPYSKGVRVDLSAAALPAHGYGPCSVNTFSQGNVAATYLGKSASWAAYNGKCVGGCRSSAR
ncbi:MAG: hypothetical protein NTX64_09395 [Elusimicrobia bacterium]|nr:hypothetical protein [Elusimicrobiota bacterium]